MSQSTDIGQNSDEGTIFIISRYLVNPSNKIVELQYQPCIDVKLGPLTKLDKRNMVTSKKIDNDVMSANIVVTFLTYDQFGAIWKLDSRSMACKT